MGAGGPALVRNAAPEARHDLGLWPLYHRNLRRTKRVRLVRERMLREVGDAAPLFEGPRPQTAPEYRA